MTERIGETMTGMFAISKAGHDKEQMYVIIKEEGDFFYLADGKSKGIEKPKKKRKKHIQIVKTGTSEVLAEKLKNGQTVYNEEIRFAIKSRIDKEITHVKS